MARNISLQIPQPCSESWAAMTPTAQGRHCAACQQTVVDFTLKTDAEILALLADAAGSRTCGRFAAGQLGRPLQRAAPAAPMPARWRTWLAAAAALWAVREGVGTAAKAQVPTEVRKLSKVALRPEEVRAERKPEKEDALPAPWVLKGMVQDSVTREGLPGVTVLIKGTTTGTSTDASGQFSLTVPAENRLTGLVQLQITYLGYVTEERLISANAPVAPVLLRADVKGLMEVVVAGGVHLSRPWPWHPRSFLYWGKYWLTRPFRRG
ncbi:carboxypeptidase-like regulatory domain-containing protein [Hymenobacter sp. M29]|uniref:Carboxypeptidase-like regulatory domain-containing protein n=1 Tax=Hymenobacter mellowenesis TaxID=3063995 RepID=A0ABT9A743_9BACT|nr:carboxypeptidase-like regulatory domain-containing protein [Hymenobacter sp. M29]MDO7845207.1 carboxypeptidase-like regulatory domain-containing protein [Hymenobacter sp. M29]